MNAPETVTLDFRASEEAGQLVKDADQLAASFRGYAVTSPEAYTKAGEDLKRIKGLQTRGEALRKTDKEPYLQGGRAVDAYYKQPLDWLANAERVIKAAMIGFSREQERQRQIQEAKAREAAAKEQAKLEARAEKMEAKGKTEQAEALRTQAALVPTPVVSVQTPQVAGISTRKTYKARVSSLTKLIAAVAAGTVPEMALVANESFLNGQARQLKGALNYPGVEVVEEEGLASRGF